MSDLASFAVVKADEIVVGFPSGEIDLSNAKELESQIENAVPNTALGMVLDLSELRYLDSSGIRLLLSLAGVAVQARALIGGHRQHAPARGHRRYGACSVAGSLGVKVGERGSGPAITPESLSGSCGVGTSTRGVRRRNFDGMRS